MTPDINTLNYERKNYWTTLIDTTSETGIIYIGKVLPNIGTNETGWQILKIDTTTTPISMTYANSAKFTEVWDDRSSLTYS